jgi:hypothetical protein
VANWREAERRFAASESTAGQFREDEDVTPLAA